VLARRALEQVYGVDLNPNVVAIARFRLLLAALQACGVTRLTNAPDFRLNLAVGDSLLHGARFQKSEGQRSLQQTFADDELFHDELKHFYESEDREELHRILGQQYHVVVGNPPYITVKDKSLNEAYRNRFDSCLRWTPTFRPLSAENKMDSRGLLSWLLLFVCRSLCALSSFGKERTSRARHHPSSLSRLLGSPYLPPKAV